VRAIKSLVGLFLVLAIQLLQVQSALASGPSASCHGAERASCCCTGEDHCPCVKSAPEKDSKTPLSPVSSETKAPEFIEPSSEVPARDSRIHSLYEVREPLGCGRFPVGYLGVSLSVAFCRFVI